jgi:hypothetical protein
MLHPRRKGRKTRRRFDLCRSHILQLFFGRSEVSPLQLFSVPQDGEKEDAESRTTHSHCIVLRRPQLQNLHPKKQRRQRKTS